MNLLLVESRELIRAGLKALLELEGHCVTAVPAASCASVDLLKTSHLVLVGAADAPQEGRVLYLPVGYEGLPFAVVAALLGAPAVGGRVGELGRREHDVMRLLAAGMSNRQIAQTLHLSEKTVKYYLTVLFRKIQVSNRGAAISWYFLQNTTKV